MNRLSPWKVARNLFIVFMCVTAAVVVSVGINDRTVPRYRSVARVLVTPNTAMYEGRDLLTALDTLNRATVLATYVEVLDSPHILQSAAAPLGVVVGEDAPYEVSSLVLPGANILEVTSEGTDPITVAALANAVVARGVAYLQQRFVMYQIDVLDVAEPAPEPYAPNEMRSALVAGTLAAGVGVLLASLLGWSATAEALARPRVQARSGSATPVLKR